MKKLFKKIVFFIFIFYLFNLIIGAFLEIPVNDLKRNKQYYPELRWNDFFEQSENSVDCIFLGSSHCYRSFVPSVFDSVLEINSFNMGSASQTPETSYYIMKEVEQTQKPKLVIMELSWMNLIDNDVLVGADNNQFSNRFYNFENFRSKKNKFNFIINTFNYKDYIYYFFSSIRYRRNYVSAINSILGKKKEKPNENYLEKGYVKNTMIVDSVNISDENSLYLKTTFSEDLILSSLEKSLTQFLKEHSNSETQILLITAPIAPTAYNKMKDYDKSHNYFQAIANKYKLPYIDYNHLNSKLNIIHDKHFKDDNHLNYDGALVFSLHLSQTIKKMY